MFSYRQMPHVLAFILCFSLRAYADDATETRGIASKQNTPPLMHMPWYTAKPFSDHWGWHWTMNHFDPEQEVDGQRQIASKYHPLIGSYDSGDPHVLEYHLLLMKVAGIETRTGLLSVQSKKTKLSATKQLGTEG